MANDEGEKVVKGESITTMDDVEDFDQKVVGSQTYQLKSSGHLQWHLTYNVKFINNTRAFLTLPKAVPLITSGNVTHKAQLRGYPHATQVVACQSVELSQAAPDTSQLYQLDCGRGSL